MKSARITVLQGVDATFPVNWAAGGRPVDFTGCTARLALRVKPDDVAPTLSVTTDPAGPDGAITLGTPTNSLGPGFLVFEFTATGSAKLTAPVYRGELLVTFTDGRERALLALDVFVRNRSTY